MIRELKAPGGEGGMIAIDARGKLAIPYSSETMLHVQVSSLEPPEVVVEIRK